MSTTGRDRLAFEAFGARIAVECDDPTVLDRLRHRLPPGAQPADGGPADDTYSIVVDGPAYRLLKGGDVEVDDAGSDDIVEQLASRLDFTVALRARDTLFVHAGVVAADGVAILVPGRSTSGKTTLVDALVKAGASYYSDEYAVIEPDGFVRPYPKPMALRGADGLRPSQALPPSPVDVADRAIPAGLVVVTHFVPGATWSPRPLSGAQGVLALLDNTVRAQSLPVFGLGALARLASGARTIGGPRGEAVPVAGAVLQYVHEARKGLP